mgnify:CR=1 FL=1
MISYIFALSAAAIWSLTGLISTRAVRYFGSYNFNFLRLLGIIVLFTPYAYIHWSPIYFENSIIIAIALSSIIGIVIGDTFLYICLKRLGPRREALLFSIQIPCTILMADIFLNALPNFYQLLGCGLIFIGLQHQAPDFRSEQGHYAARGRCQVDRLTRHVRTMWN